VSRNAEAIRELFAGLDHGARSLGWSKENPEAAQTEAAARMVADVLGRVLDSDVEYVEDPAWPGAGTYRGRDWVLARFREYWETVAFEPPKLLDLIEVPGGLIIVYCVEGTGQESGTPFHQDIAWTTEMHDGVIERIEVDFDPSRALRRAGVASVE
jgi:ketosteroid isomerase-like protein